MKLASPTDKEGLNDDVLLIEKERGTCYYCGTARVIFEKVPDDSAELLTGALAVSRLPKSYWHLRSFINGWRTTEEGIGIELNQDASKGRLVAPAVWLIMMIAKAVGIATVAIPSGFWSDSRTRVFGCWECDKHFVAWVTLGNNVKVMCPCCKSIFLTWNDTESSRIMSCIE